MVNASFQNSLAALTGRTVVVADSGQPSEPGVASAKLLFSDGAWLRADYWRTIEADRAGLSSFDHGQKYGLRAAIDAISWLTELLQDKTVTQAKWDVRSGDLTLTFQGEIELSVFNFTSYEAWEIRFPDGKGELSNYASCGGI
jgi:hypothetical protein